VVVSAVGFDLDGTLFDHQGASADAVDTFVSACGATPSDDTRRRWLTVEDEQFALWRSGQVTFQEQRRRRLRAFLPEVGVAVPSGEDELDALFDRYLDGYRAAWRPFPDSAEVVSGLVASGYRVGILTNGDDRQQRDKLRVTGLADLVHVVCTSGAMGVQKPDARAFRTLAMGLGVPESACLYVGDDLEADLNGAEAAGMRALLVDRSGEHAGGISAAVAAAIRASV
jgi:putative hydrolase of the HAD superfamily